MRIFSQEFDEKIISTTSKIMLIELASVEQIELKMNESADKMEVLYKNTDVQNTPIITDNGTTVRIAVSKNATNLKGTDKNKYRAGQPIYPSYEIRIPKDMEVQLFYDKGNFKTNDFYGNLDLHLNSGEVTINQFKGVVNIESFSGNINCSMNAAVIAISSNKGEIVSHLKDVRLVETATSLNGIFKNANNVLKIKTIHAKVILKTRSTQK